jgi:PAS domain S-box-containing protein/putative nucleotidyltransferase with HDIG domain
MISWEITPLVRWKQIRNYAVVLTLPILIAFFPLLAHYAWEALLLLCLSANFGIFYHASNLEKKAMIEMLETQGDATSLLVNQINTRYNEVLLIQEIGQATSKILDTDPLLKFVVEALEKRLDFGRGMIMLANKDKDEIVYTVGYGYNPEHEAVLKQTAFHVDRAESRGAAVVSFRQQIPVLVNDLNEIRDQISQRSLDFARLLDVESFISVPIVYEKESLGVLMVDNPRSRRTLSQSDVNLLMGIAPQIAISLKNAMAYGMIREREQRFRSLSENSPDIIYTLGRDGAFTYVNPAWEKILGYEVRDVIGRYFIDFARKGDVSQYVRQFKRVRDERWIIQDEIGALVHRDGTDRHFIIGAAPNLDAEGNVIGVVGTFKDISDLKRSEEELRQSYEKLRATLDVTIQAISMIVEARDPYTSGHQERVARLSCAIAEEMGLPKEQVTGIRMAALLHDVGKINVPAEILSKPTRLNEIEFGMIRTHPQVGYNILKTIDFPFPVDKIVLQHHERMNGSGYPAGLLGQDIILEARILAVSDVVESMASHRPYRPAQTVEAALEEIQQYKGVSYDPGVVDACLRVFQQKGFKL